MNLKKGDKVKHLVYRERGTVLGDPFGQDAMVGVMLTDGRVVWRQAENLMREAEIALLKATGGPL